MSSDALSYQIDFSTLARLACILFCSANGGIHINVFAISRITQFLFPTPFVFSLH